MGDKGFTRSRWSGLIWPLMLTAAAGVTAGFYYQAELARTWQAFYQWPNRDQAILISGGGLLLAIWWTWLRHFFAYGDKTLKPGKERRPIRWGRLFKESGRWLLVTILQLISLGAVSGLGWLIWYCCTAPLPDPVRVFLSTEVVYAYSPGDSNQFLLIYADGRQEEQIIPAPNPNMHFLYHPAQFEDHGLIWKPYKEWNEIIWLGFLCGSGAGVVIMGCLMAIGSLTKLTKQ